MFDFILFHLNLLMSVDHMSDKCLISAQLCGGDPLPLRGAISCIQTQLTGDVVTFSHWHTLHTEFVLSTRIHS